MRELLLSFFPDLSDKQLEQFELLPDLYGEWNSKINVISRKDIDELPLHHVLHSLSIAKYIRFAPETKILDVGTGGGFPGIPLAIFFPQVQFVLLDSIGKKIRVAQEISRTVGLQNVSFNHARVEDEKRKFDFIVSRAVMPLDDLVKATRKNISNEQHNALPNGIICLKGGDLTSEIHRYRKQVEITDLSAYFPQPYFKTKKIVYLPI